MSLKTTIFSIILFFILNEIHAQQKEYLFKLPTVKPSINTTFVCDKILDQRINKENIGYILRGAQNDVIPANIEGVLDSILKEQTNKTIFGSIDRKGLVLILHELNISVRPRKFDYAANCRMDVEFAEERGKELYSLGSFSHEIKSGGGKIRREHAVRINECLRVILDAFNQSSWETREAELIDQSPIVAFDYNKAPPPGLYDRFGNLARGDAFQTTGFHILNERTLRKIKRYKIQGIQDKSYKRIEFVSDGANLYLPASRYSLENFWGKSKHIGRYVYFEDKFMDANAAVVLGAAFGAVGMLFSIHKQGVVIDCTTGGLIIINNEKILELIEDYPDIKKSYLTSRRTLEDKEQAIVSLNEKFK